jgi:ATP-dependent DNA helicase PIF1
MAKIDLNLRSDLSLTQEVRTVRTASESAPAPEPLPGIEEITGALPRSAPETSETPAAESPVALWPDPCPPFTLLAGAAGSGKTFATKDWAGREKGLLLCATTGIAAINLGGTTINAILGYFDTKSLQEKYTSGFLTATLGKLWKVGVKRLIVDEVSMLAGDQLTYLVKAVDEVNDRGYVLKARRDEDDERAGPPQMGLTLVGDFAQLPPVKAPFAFESPEWERFAEPGNTITLTEIRRQADPAFIEALRAARAGEGRKALDFFGPLLQAETDDTFAGPTLLAKNDSVDRYNWIRLSRLTGADCYFESSRAGKQRSEWGNPDKPPATWGIPLRLHLKIGTLVMVLANKRNYPLPSYAYVNGDLGEVVEADETNKLAYVKLQRTGAVVPVDYVRREVLIPLDSARRKELIEKGESDKIAEGGKWEIAGWIQYMPLRVAYASTVHKSQGLSLDHVQVNIRDAFFKSPGMLYVALSRARSAGGLRLVGSQAAFVERCTVDPRLAQWL